MHVYIHLHICYCSGCRGVSMFRLSKREVGEMYTNILSLSFVIKRFVNSFNCILKNVQHHYMYTCFTEILSYLHNATGVHLLLHFREYSLLLLLSLDDRDSDSCPSTSV